MPVCETLTMHVRFIIAVVGLGVTRGVAPVSLLCRWVLLDRCHVYKQMTRAAKHTQNTPNASNTTQKLVRKDAAHDDSLLAMPTASPARGAAPTWRDVLNYNIGNAEALVLGVSAVEISPHAHCYRLVSWSRKRYAASSHRDCLIVPRALPSALLCAL